MSEILRKRLPRDLKSNFFRYLALAFLIVMGMYVVVTVVGAADTIITGTADKAAQNHIEDGQFSVFFPLTDAQEKELTDTGIELEKMFSMDMEAEDSSIVRLMKNRENINLIDIDEGHLAENSGEVVLEKRYCEEHGLKTGDSITISGLEFKITGIGSTPDYDMPIQNFSDMAVESNRFGTGFVTENQYEEIRENNFLKSEEYCYAYRLNASDMTDNDIKQIVKEFSIDYTGQKDAYSQMMFADSTGLKVSYFQTMFADSAGVKASYSQAILADSAGKNLTSFVKKADNPRIFAAAGDMRINKEAGLLAGVIVMILFTYVISVFVIHQIQQESSVIGTLYALGAKKKDLLLHYITLPTILTFVGGVAGALLGFSKAGIPTQTADSYNYFSIPNLDVYYPPYLIVYSIAMPPVVSVIVNYIVINKRLSQTALSLIRNEQKVKLPYPQIQSYALPSLIRNKHKVKMLYQQTQSSTSRSLIRNKHKVKLPYPQLQSSTPPSFISNEQKINSTRNINHSKIGKMKFIRNFQFRQMMRERRTGFTVVCGMIISLLVLMLGLNCYVLCRNVQKDTINSTKFGYMYLLKYPEKEVPDGGEACYAKTLIKTAMGYTVNVSVIGIDKNNTYYETEPVKGKNSLTISKSVQQKYGLHIGDEFVLTDNAEDMDYAFTVEGICDYAGGLAVFMDIGSMRELFGQEKDYYNMLLSDKELAIDEGRIYNITTREDIAHSASVFTSLMMPLVIMMLVSAVIIFCMVLYLMMGIMIDRAAFGISLVQIFGFRTGEIRKLYLNGNTWIAAAGAVIGIPLAKIIMDALYPWIIANTAVGMNLKFPWYMYAGIFAGVMAVYFAVNTFLVRKLKRITPAEVLKNRE